MALRSRSWLHRCEQQEDHALDLPGSGDAEQAMARTQNGAGARSLFSRRQSGLSGMVGVRGFEPPTPASRTQYSTRLSYTPIQETDRSRRIDGPVRPGSGAPAVPSHPRVGRSVAAGNCKGGQL